MLMIFLPLMISFSLFFTQMKHPLAMGLILLTQTSLIAISAGLLSHSFWISYIMFLIFLGALLVLFIYVASLAANEQFNFNIKLALMFITLSLVLSSIFMFLDPIFSAQALKFEKSSHSLTFMENSLSSITSSLYEIPSAQFTLFIISYLLLALIVIVKIMNMKSKPLRTS
uniref:NADH-ubiquinone oxidoreductase chain 6 n=1 Tax=Neopetrolisthes maculatus TaxID=941218 RepID=L0E7A7_9EUCA|nr:NADH dehydrogenase subunit 6 [Neopetrolisthes maculatus]AGA56152.1 NADH dehydrogenase subunit 6 [Neopetrolisthes maculatus]